jgi:hypothetical protein
VDAGGSEGGRGPGQGRGRGMSEDVGVLCSPVALFFAGVVATMSVIALYAEMKALAWTSAALSVASSLVLAVCFWGVLDG